MKMFFNVKKFSYTKTKVYGALINANGHHQVKRIEIKDDLGIDKPVVVIATGT